MTRLVMRMETGYRQTLRRILIERCQRNPKYSLRAFARDLNLAPARLSDVLNGKRGLSRASALPIAKTLGLTKDETEIFCDQVEALHGRNRIARSSAQKRLAERTDTNDANSLSLDAFHTVSDWYHFAILQLLSLPNAQSDVAWIAKALGLKSVQVEDALERLLRLELIEKKRGRYVPTQDSVFSPDGVPSEAIRKFHEQVLQKATTALFVQSVNERDFLNVMLPFDPDDLERARKRIRAFSRQILKEYSERASASQVYNLSIQFFNLTPQLKEPRS